MLIRNPNKSIAWVSFTASSRPSGINESSEVCSCSMSALLMVLEELKRDPTLGRGKKKKK